MNPCIECSECCEWVTFIIPQPSGIQLTTERSSFLKNALVEFYEARGCKIKDAIGDNMAVMVPSVCPHLSVKGCDIYDKRPDLCRQYDGRLDRYMKDVCRLDEMEE